MDNSAVDVPLSWVRDYGYSYIGEAVTLDAPFVEPENRIRESYANPRPQWHIVKVDSLENMMNGGPADDEAWPMSGERGEFPRGAVMPVGSLEPMDDYRLVYDGSHA